MTLIHLDAVGGIAGDMFVAAMLDAFPDLRPRVLADAEAVLPSGAGPPELREGENGGIRAFTFGLARERGRRNPSRDRHHTKHSDDASFPALAARIKGAALSHGTAAEATALLTILAEAESAIHGVPLEKVHFHELADWDSLVDMTAAGSIAAALQGARWTVSDLPLGGGTVKTAHGILPVPAPATALILQGFAWRDDGIDGERVTPTGAAIVKHLVGESLPRVAARLQATGTGAGTRSLPGQPNILRALVFEPVRHSSSDRVTIVAFEVDDMTGEEIGVAAERLRAVDGVLDLSVAQRWGKKGRPMQSFQLIVREAAADEVIRRCFAETSTIGLRVSEQTRFVLARESADVGGVGVKSAFRPGAGVTRKAESDDLPGDDLAARRTAKQNAEGQIP